MFPSHHLPHIHRKIFLSGTAFASVFFNRETNCSLLEASIQWHMLNKYTKFHKTQVSTVQLLSFLLYCCPACCSRYPQLLASKLLAVHAVSPEQHHGTGQVEIQPEGAVATNVPKSGFAILSAMKLNPSHPSAGGKRAASHPLELPWSCPSCVLTRCQMGFPKPRVQQLHRLLQTRERWRHRPPSFMLIEPLQCSVAICLPYPSSCSTGASLSLDVARYIKLPHKAKCYRHFTD